MDSAADPPSLEGVAPFGDPRIKACSRLPRAFRSVPRPSSPLGAKASTRCPCFPRPPAATTTNTTPCSLRLHGGPGPSVHGTDEEGENAAGAAGRDSSDCHKGPSLRGTARIPMPDDVSAHKDGKTKRRAKTSTCRCPSHARRRRRIAPPQARGRAPHHHLTMSKQQGPALCLAADGHAWWAWADLNGRPHAYQACALTS